MPDPTPNSAPLSRAIVCAACGGPLTCTPGACWCDSVTLTDDVRATLRARYDDCLCANCLRTAAAAVTTAPDGGHGQDT